MYPKLNRTDFFTIVHCTNQVRNEKRPIPESVRCQNKWTQSGTAMLRYRTQMMDEGMPMPAESALMPMPSFAPVLLIICFTSDVNPLDPAGMAAQLVSEVQLALLIHCVHQDLNMIQEKVENIEIHI
jgi:hypothetical protein